MSPVRIVPDLLDDFGGAAHARDGLIRGQNHAEFEFLIEAARDHHLVARLEDVEREFGSWHKHHVERKKGNAVWSLHVLRSRRDAGLAKQRQGRLHFVPRVHVSRFLRDHDTVGK